MERQLHIVLLEDNPSDAELVQRELRQSEADIVTHWAQDKVSFLEALDQHVPDLIIADYALPGFDGLTALNLARAKLPHVPGIIISGAIGEERAIELLRGGATDYVLKDRLSRLAPVVERALLEAQEISGRRRAEEELRRHRDRLEELVQARTAEVQEQSRVLESVFNHSLSCLVLLDADFNFIRVNEAYAKACARPVEDFIGHNHFVDYPSEELQGIFEQVVRERNPWQIGARPFTFVDHPDWGTTYWDLSVVPILDAGEQVELLLFSLQDVTELTKARTQLQQQRDRLEEMVAALEANQAHLRALSAQLVTAEQRERQRLATIVHDEIAQTLGAMKLHLGVLRSKYPDAAGDQFAHIAAMLNQATQQARSIMTELNPPVLQRLGLVEALRWWGELVQERNGSAVQVDAAPERLLLDNVVEATLFQAVKELIQNSLKHAEASAIEVTVRSADSRLEITVADNGVGFDPAGTETTADCGFGLFNIRERMAYLGGECSIESSPGDGTRVTLQMPVNST